MDEKEFFKILQVQKQWLQTAKIMKGQKRTPSYRREILLQEYSSSRRVDSSTNQIRSTIVGEAYAPCYMPIDDLKKIHLKDLKLETHHHGCSLILRVFGTPWKLSSIMIAVEDESGDLDRLAVYNTKETIQPREFLPEKCVIAIKEPYYKMSADKRCILRIDHPSDIIFLGQDHQLLPSIWKQALVRNDQQPAVSWKIQGNHALGQKSWLEASRCYTSGLKVSSNDEVSIKRDLFRNRAHVNLLLGRYDTAKEDALASTSGEEDPTSKTLDAKAYYRCGLAAYQLEDYEDASRLFERVLLLSPSDEDGLRELERTKDCLREIHEGSYDFVVLIKQIARSKFLADRASFISNTEVRQTTDRGRGLFAVQDVAFGDLILCEKAFMAAHDVGGDAVVSLMVNLNSDRASMGTNASVWVRTVQKIIDNPSLGPQVLDLFAGKSLSQSRQVPIVDSKPIVDTFHIQQIVEYNAFGYAVGRESEAYGNVARVSETRHKSTGLWSRASYANHACLFNAQRSFIGDLMILRATKDIPQGTEITIAYQLTDSDIDKRQNTMFKNWGFNCSCLLCETEKPNKENRASLVRASEKFLEIDVHSIPKQHEVKRAEQLARKIENTYQHNLSRNMPCLALSPVCAWLSQAYFLLRNLDLVRTTTKKVLQSYGYTVDVQGSKVRWDSTNGIPAPEVVDALVRMSLTYTSGKEHCIGAEFVRLAEKLYEIVNGTLFRFEKRYGSLKGDRGS